MLIVGRQGVRVSRAHGPIGCSDRTVCLLAAVPYVSGQCRWRNSRPASPSRNPHKLLLIVITWEERNTCRVYKRNWFVCKKHLTWWYYQRIVDVVFTCCGSFSLLKYCRIATVVSNQSYRASSLIILVISSTLQKKTRVGRY